MIINERKFKSLSMDDKKRYKTLASAYSVSKKLKISPNDSYV